MSGLYRTREKGASLGTSAVIRVGVIIGAFPTVRADTVVTKDVPSYALVVVTLLIE